jgi:50S ribosomal protein L16 3-hydroxylase
MIIQQFDSALFLREYWQKKPCVIKQFVKEFADPIDEHDLAGLAQEEGVDCRIVSKTLLSPNKQHDWHVAQGPFASFEELCVGDWSLLVQGVDRYIPEIDIMAKRVDFIPNWRFDDVMVSFSVANAGVGAHTDQYDVFIIQGKGSRRWQVGLPIKGNVESLSPHPLLRQIAGFEPIIDEVLVPGDVVYIPPNHPHNGVALEDCLNYSIGFRSPTHLEALTGLLDESDTLNALQQRYTDPNIGSLRASNLAVTEVSRGELGRVKQGIVELLDSPQAEKALLQYLSRQGLPDLSNEDVYSVPEVETLFQEGTQIYKTPGVRPIYMQTEDDLFSFCIDGNTFELPASISAQAKHLLNDNEFLLCNTQFKDSKTPWVSLIAQLLNAGYWEV